MPWICEFAKDVPELSQTDRLEELFSFNEFEAVSPGLQPVIKTAIEKTITLN